MGTFAGHAVPGIFFILYAIWNAIKQAHNQAKLGKRTVSRYPVSYANQPTSRFKDYDPKFGSSYTPPVSFVTVVHDEPLFPYDNTIQSVFFLLCSIGGGLGVVGYGGWTFMDDDGNFSANINNWQHGTMFAFFGVYFTLRLLSQTNLGVEPEMEKLWHSLSFFVEAFLFIFHLHGRDDLDIHLHRLLILAILGSAVCLLAQVWRPGDPILDHMWVVSCLLHGMWFLMAGFVLYNPVEPNTSWKHDEHASMMMATAVYTWQLLLAIIINCLIRWIVIFCVNLTGNRNNNQFGKETEDTTEMATLLDVTHNGFEIDNGL